MGTGLSASFITGLTDTFLTDKEGVGKHRYEDGKWYKWVLYDDGTGNLDIVAGDALYYLADSFTTVTADLTDADTLPIGAGIATGTVTVTATYMWIQFKGAATFSLDPLGTTPGDGDAICAPTSTGTDKTVIVDPPDNRSRMGVMSDDSDKTVFLDCPF